MFVSHREAGFTWVEGSDCCMAVLYLRCSCRAVWLLLLHAAAGPGCATMWWNAEKLDYQIILKWGARARSASQGSLWSIMSSSYQRLSIESRVLDAPQRSRRCRCCRWWLRVHAAPRAGSIWVEGFTPRTHQIPFSESKSFGASRSLIYRDLRGLDHVWCRGSVRSRSYVHVSVCGIYVI